MDPLSLSSAAVGMLSLTIQLISFTSTYIKGAKNGTKSAQELKDELVVFQQVLESFKTFVESENIHSDTFTETSLLCVNIRSFEGQLKGLCQRLGKPLQRRKRIWARLSWPLKEEEFLKFSERLNRITGLLQLSLTIDNCKLLLRTSAKAELRLDEIAKTLPTDMQRSLLQQSSIKLLIEELRQSTDDVQADVRMLKNKQVEEVLDEMLLWLSPLEPRKRHQDVRSVRLADTGEWLLKTQQFNDWVLEKSASSVHGCRGTLFCHGIPGAGKTVLNSLVVEHLLDLQATENSNIGVACVYCDYRDKEIQTPVNMIGALIKQLLCSLPTVPDLLYKKWQLSKSTKEALELPLALSLLDQVCVSFDTTYICIDAADEIANDQWRRSMLEPLRRLPAKIFITGRHNINPQVTKLLEPDYRLEIIASEDDIRRYVSNCIENDASDIDEELMDDEFKTNIIKTICQNHNGMFLLATRQIESVLEPRRKSKRRDALERLPKGLFDAYSEGLDRIRRQPQSYSEEALSILMWVALTARPLTVDELRYALGVKIGEELYDLYMMPPAKSLLIYCLGLVVIDEETSTLRLVHYTLQEYFQTHSDVFPLGHSILSQTCLTFLSCDLVRQQEKVLRRENETTSNLMPDSKELPFYRYAARFWGYHASRDTGNSYVTLAKAILNNRPLFQLAVRDFLLSIIEDIPPFAWRLQYLSTFQEAKDISPLDIISFFGLKSLALEFSDMPFPLEAIKNNSSSTLSALHWAILGFHSSKENFDSLISCISGAEHNINSTAESGLTPLHLACMLGNEGAVQWLLDNKADLNAESETFGRPIYLAITGARDYETSKKVAIVRSLANAGADVTSSLEDFVWGRYLAMAVTPLHQAAEEANEEMVSTLISCDADIDAQDRGGATPLFKALNQADGEAAGMLLLKSGANSELKSKSNQSSPLHAALSTSKINAVKFMCDHGTDLHSTDIHGNGAIYFATSGNSSELIPMLIARGVDLDARSHSGHTALESTLVWTPNSWETIETLVKCGASTERLAHYATHSNYCGNGMVSRLQQLHVKLDLRHPDFDGKTPLECGILRAKAVFADDCEDLKYLRHALWEFCQDLRKAGVEEPSDPELRSWRPPVDMSPTQSKR